MDLSRGEHSLARNRDGIGNESHIVRLAIGGCRVATRGGVVVRVTPGACGNSQQYHQPRRNVDERLFLDCILVLCGNPASLSRTRTIAASAIVLYTVTPATAPAATATATILFMATIMGHLFVALVVYDFEFIFERTRCDNLDFSGGVGFFEIPRESRIAPTKIIFIGR